MKLLDSSGSLNHIVPISNGLLRPPHVERMGPGLVLFVLFEDLVTTGEGTDGLVKGGQPVADVELANALGLHRKTVGAYRRRLEAHGYIRTVRTGSGYIVRVMKSKKWAWRQELKPKNGSERWPKSEPEMAVFTTEMAKIEAERSQKVPSRSDKAAKRDKAAEAAAAWNWIGIQPCGPTPFQRLFETSFANRNGHSQADLMAHTLDQWDLIRGRQPRPKPFCVALDEFRQRERAAPAAPRSVSQSTVVSDEDAAAMGVVR